MPCRFHCLIAIVMALLVSGCLPDVSIPQPTAPEKIVYLDQGWTSEQRAWFHHVSQGANTIPIPLEWFMALEQPELKLLDNPGLLSDGDYLSRFGFTPSPHSEQNPVGLPVGFAVNLNQKNPVTNTIGNTVGFTCSACHTAQMTYKGTALRIDGAPAMANLSMFTNALVVSVAYTRFVPGRFDRFADRVLGSRKEDHNARSELKQQLQAAIRTGVSLKKYLDRNKKETINEGFARVDALNRIGNQVFGVQWNMDKNYAPFTAPVNFPAIWNASWYDWVQYDASIMQPMVRNAGEALGVNSPLNLQPGPQQFASTARIDNIFAIENLLAGPADPYTEKKFSGLQSPRWPEAVLGRIDPVLAAQGEQLYDKHCLACHRPSIDKPEFWSSRFWKKTDADGPALYHVPAIAIDKIGTDSAQASVVTERTVDITGMQLDTEVCVCSGNQCSNMKITDGEQQSFALALGAVVQKTVQHWYDDNSIAPELRTRMNGGRPNCLRAEMAYMARPLNGIWATAPYLHNASVPNLYALLSPLEERPKTFWLGSQEFDPVNVGYVSAKIPGASELDTSLPGNRNSGHEFADKKDQKGVIGPLLQPSERQALIEYLKGL